MKPAYAIYVLESEWSWDHTNKEIATFTVEGIEGDRWQQELECLIDPLCPEDVKNGIMEDFKDIAKIQNKCRVNCTPHLLRLYRVVNCDGSIVQQPTSKRGAPQVNLTLKLICGFDRKGNIIIPNGQQPSCGDDN